MSGDKPAFQFPPPPPPPPKATEDPSAQYGPPRHAFPPRGHYNDRDFRGRGRANQRGFPRAGYGRGQALNEQGFRGSSQLPHYMNPGQDWNQSRHRNNHEAYSNPNFIPSSAPSQPWRPDQTPQIAFLQSSRTPPEPSSNWDSSNRQAVIDPRGGPGSMPTPSSSQPYYSRGGANRRAQYAPNIQRTQAPPAVPSFLAPVLPTKPPVPSASNASELGSRMAKRRKYNMLGLTPRTDEQEESEEEPDPEQDEEAILATKLAAGPEPQQLAFEYRGNALTLSSQSEIQAWIEERKRRFPTKTRILEKQATSKKPPAPPTPAPKHAASARIETATTPSDAQQKRDRMAKKLKEQQKKLARLDAEIADSKASPIAENSLKCDAPSKENTNVEQEPAQSGPSSPTLSPLASSTSSSASYTSSDLSSSPSPSNSNGEVEGDGEDSAPEEVAAIHAPTQQPPTLPSAAQRNPALRPCRSFASTGRCRFLAQPSGCRYSHDVSHKAADGSSPVAKGQKRKKMEEGKKKGEGEKPGRIGLYERMLEAERKKEDVRVLDAIRFLGEGGVLG